jgi:hypothetical protein
MSVSYEKPNAKTTEYRRNLKALVGLMTSPFGEARRNLKLVAERDLSVVKPWRR